MKEFLKSQIIKYVQESRENRYNLINDCYYDKPIIKFASADDPLFETYKTVIDKKHLTPREAFELAFGENSYHGGTVISIVLPINEKISESNRPKQKWPSKEWVGEEQIKYKYFKCLGDFVIRTIQTIGYRAVAPMNSEWYKLPKYSDGFVANWSERHIAYAAGLGTFGLNGGFITVKCSY